MDPLLNLSQINAHKLLSQNEAPGSPASPDAPSFRDLFQKALQEVNTDEQAAEREARNLMTGQGTDMHSAILAVQKAEVSFNTMMAVRSKLIEAYREVMRMQM